MPSLSDPLNPRYNHTTKVDEFRVQAHSGPRKEEVPSPFIYYQTQHPSTRCTIHTTVHIRKESMYKKRPSSHLQTCICQILTQNPTHTTKISHLSRYYTASAPSPPPYSLYFAHLKRISLFPQALSPPQEKSSNRRFRPRSMAMTFMCPFLLVLILSLLHNLLPRMPRRMR